MGSEEKRRGSKKWKVEVSLKVAIYGTDPRTGPGNICFGFLFFTGWIRLTNLIEPEKLINGLREQNTTNCGTGRQLDLDS